MTAPLQDLQRLKTLLALASDGVLSVDQRFELQLLLKDRSDLQSEYLAYVSVDCLLRQEGTQKYLAAIVQAQSPVGAGEPSPIQQSLTPSIGRFTGTRTQSPTATDRGFNALAKLKSLQTLHERFSPRLVAWGGVVAALLMVGAATRAIFLPAPATIVDAQNAVWTDARQREIGEALGTDWIGLESGTSKIAFRSGAVMTVEGPANFRILSSGSCELQKGSLSAYVPAEAVGFRVAMAGATIVDLGTAFRVDMQPSGESLVYVTQGSVRIEPSGPGESLTLQAGEIADWSDSQTPHRQPAERLVPSSTGNLVFSNEQPASLGFGQYRHDDKIFLFLERPETILQHELRVDVISPGMHTEFYTSEGMIPAGTQVRSYLLHFSPAMQRQILSGSVTFPTRILGVLCDSDRLNATNATLGSTVLLRCAHPERGLESQPNYNSDMVSISGDRRTLRVKLRTESIDHVRVITAVEP